MTRRCSRCGMEDLPVLPTLRYTTVPHVTRGQPCCEFKTLVESNELRITRIWEDDRYWDLEPKEYCVWT